MLEGDLGDFSLPDVLRLLSFTGKTGRLTLSDGTRSGDIDLVGGRVRYTRLGTDPLALSRLLVRRGLVDAGSLEEALELAGRARDDRGILPALLAAGRLDDAALAVPLRQHVIDVVVALGRWRVGSFRFAATPALDLTDAAPTGATGTAPAIGGFSLPVDELLAEVDRRLEAHAVLDRVVGSGGSPTPVDQPGARGPATDPARPPTDPAPGDAPRRARDDAREGLGRRLHAGAAAGAPTAEATRGALAAPDAPAPAAPRTPAQLAAARHGVASAVRRPAEAAAAAPTRGAAAGRARRLGQDPTIDEALIDRLIAGVRAL